MSIHREPPCVIELSPIMIATSQYITLRQGDIVKVAPMGEYWLVTHLHTDGTITTSDLNGHGVIETIDFTDGYGEGNGGDVFIYPNILAHWRASKHETKIEYCDGYEQEGRD